MVFARLAEVSGFALAASLAMTFIKILWRRLMAASLSVSYLLSGLTAGRSAVPQGIQGFASICSGVPVLTGRPDCCRYVNSTRRFQASQLG